jgi:hypothetical protein
MEPVQNNGQLETAVGMGWPYPQLADREANPLGRSSACSCIRYSDDVQEGMTMRTETQMMDLILSVASQDERIRAVYMTGSRTNADAPEDLFQDYDIVYVVTELGSFLRMSPGSMYMVND